MLETVLYDKRDRMAFVTLNRPDAKNAIDPAMHEELCRIWTDFRDDDDVDVAILSGVGDAFCAGADLRTYVPANYVEAAPSRVREIVNLGLGGLTRGLHRIYKPVIAAIEVIGKPLDDQLRIEGWNSYTCVNRDEAAALLQRFYDKVDAGRAGANPTAL